MTLPLPPGPPGHWLSGNLPDFRRDRLAYMARCGLDYGDVVALRLGPRRVFLVQHPDGIEEVLVTQARNFTKHFALRMNPQLLGKGLLTSEGDFWLRQRRLIQPAFLSSRIVGEYGPAMVTAAENLVAGWKPGERRNIAEEMKRLTLDVTSQVLFGADVSGAASAVGKALRTMQEHFIKRFNSLMPPPWWLPTPLNLRFRRAVRELDEIIYEFIRQRRQSKVERSDLLSLLLRARDEEGGGRMTDKQVRDEAMTIFLAGHETTALALSWTWYLLARHPESEARLVEEVGAVLGGRTPTAADWPKLSYVEHVVLESMRLFPPVYTFGREAAVECVIGGYRFPAGVTVLMSPWVVQRDPRFFTEPERFRPERWSEENARKLPRFAYFPFGGGPRQCIGNSFAMMEMVLALAVIAQRYRFTLLPEPEVVPCPEFTLRPRDGVPALLTERA